MKFRFKVILYGSLLALLFMSLLLTLPIWLLLYIFTGINTATVFSNLEESYIKYTKLGDGRNE